MVVLGDKKGGTAVLDFKLPGQRGCRLKRAWIASRAPSKWRTALATSVLVFSLWLLPSESFALSFYPTESEWVTWPDYCRARYVVSGAGTTSKYVYQVSPEEVSFQRKRVGESAWVYLHHYCAGIAFLKRAAAEKDKQRADILLERAHTEIMSQYALLDPKDRTFPTVSSSVAKLYEALGNVDSAIEFLKRALESQPDTASLYAQAAIMYRDTGKIEEGLSILEQGDAATNGTSSELNYLLGLFYIEVDDLDSAVTHAERAYELGYPLPGLAAKLKRLGRSIE